MNKTYRILFALSLILSALVTMASSCEPDPTPGGGAVATANAAEEMFHAQLTAIYEFENAIEK